MPVQITRAGLKRIIIPAWLLSVLVHACLFGTLAVLTWSVDGVGSADEFDVGIVVKETLGNQQVAYQGPESRLVTRPEKPTARPKEVSDEAPSELLDTMPAEAATDLDPIAVPSDVLSEAGRLRVSVPTPTGSAGLARTRFFGIVSRGSKFVYVMDRSASMSMGANKMAIAKRELMRSLRKLPPSAQFQIIFYNQTPEVLRIGGSFRLVYASPRNLALADRAVDRIEADGMTKPRPALMKAIALGADVVYFLTDAQEMSPRVVRDVNERNRRFHKARIHAIEIGDGMPWQDESRQVAALVRQNRGTYKYINAAKYRLPPKPDRPAAP